MNDAVQMADLSYNEGWEACAAYLEAAVWSSTITSDDDVYDITEADEYELSVAAEIALIAEAELAWNSMPDGLRERLLSFKIDVSQWAHDMWLTREGHGTGFWDRPVDTYGTVELRDQLTEYARLAGEGGNFWLNSDNELEYER